MDAAEITAICTGVPAIIAAVTALVYAIRGKQALAAQFRQHTVHRRYLAIAHGDVRSRTVRSFLLEDRGDGLRGSARGTVTTPK